MGGVRKPRRTAAKKSGSALSGDALASPMRGTIVKVAAEEGLNVDCAHKCYALKRVSE